MTSRITEFMNKRLSEKQRQWAWFVILWCAGLASVIALGSVIKLIMKL